MEMKWFIETWSAFDGIAFAARRDEDDDGAEPALTVALHPPYWDAIAVSNPATALRALEHGFQHRLYDKEGEIAFDTLDEVREVVRRGYTGGGLGFGPGPGPGPAVPREGGPEVPRVEIIGEDVPDEERWREVRKELASIRIEREEAREALQWYVTQYGDEIEHHHHGMTSRYLPWFLEAFSESAESDWRDVATWFCAIEPYPWWNTFDRYSPRTREEHEAYDWLRRISYAPYDRPYWDTHNVEAILSGTLFRIPVRTRWRKVRTLGDLLAAASTSRAFVSDLRSGELHLLLLIALMVVRAPAAGLRRRRNRRHDFEAASQWLVDALPGVLSPDHRAEALLDRLVE